MIEPRSVDELPRLLAHAMILWVKYVENLVFQGSI
jgi:hypothetical protein